jgi:hypothetical protein
MFGGAFSGEITDGRGKTRLGRRKLASGLAGFLQTGNGI